MPAHQVRPYFLDDPLLGTGQIVRKRPVAGVEGGADLRHQDTHIRAAADIFLLEQRQLEQEEFLPFQAVLRFGEGVSVGGKMNIPERVTDRDQAFLLQHVFRQNLFDIFQGEIQRGGHQFIHHLTGDSPVLKPVSGIIHPGQGPGEIRRALQRRVVDLRMDHIEFAPVQTGLSEEQEDVSRPQPFVGVFDAAEEDQFHLSTRVADQHG